MKRLIIILAAALAVLSPAPAQTTGNDVKATQKTAKEASRKARSAEKSLRREGYRSYDIGTANASLQQYFQKVESGCTSIVGTSGPCITENLAKLTSLANAANEYAILHGGEIRGRITTSASSLSGAQIDNLVASFERLVEKDIRGELIPVAVFFKESGGRFSARAYCIVDEDAAARARRHAMELALAENALAEKYGTMVSDWIDEGFWKKGERQ